MSTWYAFAKGHGQSVLAKFSTVCGVQPSVLGEGSPVPTMGSIKRTTLNQRTIFNGALLSTLFIGALSKANFDALLAALSGHYAGDTAITLVLRDGAWNWGVFDGYIALPVQGDDFSREKNGDVEALSLRVRLLAPTVTSLSADTTLTSAQRHVQVDTSGGNKAITLPAASGTTNVVFAVTKSAAANNLTVTDGGALSIVTTALNARTMVVSSGSAWSQVT